MDISAVYRGSALKIKDKRKIYDEYRKECMLNALSDGEKYINYAILMAVVGKYCGHGDPDKRHEAVDYVFARDKIVRKRCVKVEHIIP